MAITPFPHPTPAGVVAGAGAELDSVAGSLWSAREDEELVAGVEELQALKAKAAALEAELLAELDAREVPKRRLAWASTADWFSHLAGVTRRQGKRTVVHAKRLVGERAATLAALRAGAISPEQAGVVLDGVEKLPLSGGVRERGEEFLLTQAGRLNATDLHRAARHLAAVADPDGADRKAERDLDREERAAHLGRFLTVTDDGAGGVRVKGRGSVEDAAWLRTALLPLTAPVPGVDPATGAEAPDPRDHGTRMWDALVQLARHALDTDLPPASHGARPRVAVRIDADTLTGHPDAEADAGRSAGHRHGPTGEPGPGTGVTEDGLELPASAVRRMACDCDLIRILLDAEGCVLDVGRSQRLVTPGIWTALVARDGHCGCSPFRARRAKTQPHRARSARGRRCALKQAPLAATANGASPTPSPDRAPHAVAGPARRRRPTRVPAAAQTPTPTTDLAPTPHTPGVTARRGPGWAHAARRAKRPRRRRPTLDSLRG